MANCKQELYVPELPKWKQHGWREEKAYQPDVLIGNWYENRMKVKFTKLKIYRYLINYDINKL